MIDSKVSRRYASSLLENSIENKSLEKVFEDIEFVLKTLRDNKELKKALISPIIKAEVKSNIITDVYKTRVSAEVFQFLIFILNKNRIDRISDILEMFVKLRDAHLGITNVVISSAFNLENEQREVLESRLKELLEKDVRVKYKIDKSIIGGFIAKTEDTVFDASIKHQLELLKKQFVSGIILN